MQENTCLDFKFGPGHHRWHSTKLGLALDPASRDAELSIWPLGCMSHFPTIPVSNTRAFYRITATVGMNNGLALERERDRERGGRGGETERERRGRA